MFAHEDPSGWGLVIEEAEKNGLVGMSYMKVNQIEYHKSNNVYFIGPDMPYRCPRHPDGNQLATWSAKCYETCNGKMECGHVCINSCHAGEHPDC